MGKYLVNIFSGLHTPESGTYRQPAIVLLRDDPSLKDEILGPESHIELLKTAARSSFVAFDVQAAQTWGQAWGALDVTWKVRVYGQWAAFAA